MRGIRFLAAGCAALMSCAATAQPQAWAALQPSVYLRYSFGAPAARAPALRLGAQWSFSERTLEGLAARLAARDLAAADFSLPPLLHLEFGAQRHFSGRMLGSELVAHTPRQLDAAGTETGGWHWSSGKTWLAVGVVATAAIALAGGEGEDRNNPSPTGAGEDGGNGIACDGINGLDPVGSVEGCEF